jgi:hypothetical protein
MSAHDRRGPPVRDPNAIQGLNKDYCDAERGECVHYHRRWPKGMFAGARGMLRRLE